MIEIRETDIYHEWFEHLKDKRAKTRIDDRIRRVSLGNFGDVRPVGMGVSELRIDYGLGYQCISPGMEISWLFYCVAGINLPKLKTFNRCASWLKRLRRNSR